MARKNYPFNKRDEKKMNKLFSGLLAGLRAPIFRRVRVIGTGTLVHKQSVIVKL